MPVLWYLRDILRLAGTKFSCGVGICGICTIHVNGEAVRSCTTPVKAIAGKTVVTIKGLGENGLHPVQQAWMDLSVPQCGYCQSGQIMEAVAFLKHTPKPTDGDIDRVMESVICRCGTYQRIREAIKRAAGVSA